MSEKSVMRMERRQAYKRSWRKARGEQKGISPVVATLILVLIAVAAAAALYIWLIGWQGGVTSTIGKPTVQQGGFTIGGSTSVYPFSEIAVTSFEQNNSGVSISNNQGGTGAGMLAVCAGAVDVGAASTAETAAGLVASDGCAAQYEATITITTVAYDAVDVITPVANDHALVSISSDTLAAIYDGSTIANGGTPTLNSGTINGVALTAANFGGATWITAGHVNAALEWQDIPACVVGTANCGGSGVTEATATAVGAGAACGGGTDICAGGGGDSPCGFAVCAGPFTAIGPVASTDIIHTLSRSDASGTTQTFEARVLAASSSTAFATSFAGLGFSGCGGNNLLSDCGLSSTATGVGNPGVIAAVAANPDALGYASDGLARATGSGVTCEGVATAACGIGLETPGQGVALQPSLGATGTIAAGVILGGFGPSGVTTTATVGYSGDRPFEYVTLAAPVGLVAQYYTWVTDPANNQLFATESGEVSIYSI
jgi:flagellin-like protein